MILHLVKRLLRNDMLIENIEYNVPHRKKFILLGPSRNGFNIFNFTRSVFGNSSTCFEDIRLQINWEKSCIRIRISLSFWRVYRVSCEVNIFRKNSFTLMLHRSKLWELVNTSFAISCQIWLRKSSEYNTDKCPSLATLHLTHATCWALYCSMARVLAPGVQRLVLYQTAHFTDPFCSYF